MRHGDDLNSRQPICQAVLDQGAHFIFVCKPSSHPLIEEYTKGVELETHEETHKRGKIRFIYRYRWIHKVPLRDGKDALNVNWFDIEIRRADSGKVTYRNSFVTDLSIDADNVAEAAACGRARWKIENEKFNVLKTKGYNLEHNFGHGRQNLAAILVTLNLLAFAIHTVCDIADDAWRAARATFGSRRIFFSDLAAITTYAIFPSWTAFLHALAGRTLPPQPPPVPPSRPSWAGPRTRRLPKTACVPAASDRDRRAPADHQGDRDGTAVLLQGHGRPSGDDTVVLAYVANNDSNDLLVTTSVDGGGTWAPSIRIGTQSSKMAPALSVPDYMNSSLDTALILAYVANNSTNDLLVTQSLDRGGTWTPSVRLGTQSSKTSPSAVHTL